MGDLQYPRFGDYSLQDEDEEEQRRRRLQELQALQMPQRDPSMEPRPSAPPRGGLSSLLTPRDPEMESRWRGAEQQALERSGYQGGQSYGAGEAVRDFAPMVVGGGLDILLNKGRGLGALAGAGMQAMQSEDARRSKDATAAGNFALQARQQREQQGNPELDAAYKGAQIENWTAQRELGWANLDQRDIKQRALEAQRTLENDPQNAQALALAAQIKTQTNGAIDVVGQLGTKNLGRSMPLATNAQRLELAEPMAAASARGTIGSQLSLEPETTAAAARKETATTLAQKKAANPALDDSGAPIAPPGTSVQGGGSYAELAKRNPAEADKIKQTDQDMSALATAHDNLSKIRAQIDGLSMMQRTANDPQFAALLGEWNDEVKRYQTLQFAAQNRGVPQAFEQKIFDVQVGNPMTWEDAASQPGTAIKSALSNQQAMMSGQHTSMQRAQEQFRQKWGFAPAQTAYNGNTNSPASGRQNLGPDASHPSNLGVQQPMPIRPNMAGRGQPSGGAAGGGAPAAGGLTFRPSGMADGSVYVTDPNGITKRVRREQAIGAGWNGQ